MNNLHFNNTWKAFCLWEPVKNNMSWISPWILPDSCLKFGIFCQVLSSPTKKPDILRHFFASYFFPVFYLHFRNRGGAVRASGKDRRIIRGHGRHGRHGSAGTLRRIGRCDARRSQTVHRGGRWRAHRLLESGQTGLGLGFRGPFDCAAILVAFRRRVPGRHVREDLQLGEQIVEHVLRFFVHSLLFFLFFLPLLHGDGDVGHVGQGVAPGWRSRYCGGWRTVVGLGFGFVFWRSVDGDLAVIAFYAGQSTIEQKLNSDLLMDWKIISKKYDKALKIWSLF